MRLASLARLAALSFTSLLFAACGGGELPDCSEDLVPGAECFDSNNVSGDGCSAECKAESAPVCGDGHVDPGEACDDGNTSNTDACLNSCEVASCGDGFVEAGVEDCDDGNNAGGDGCSAVCQTEHVCGDG